jgi:phytoene dehydrogenase-like protein
LIIYTDVDRLERHMKELAPADAKAIEELTGTVRRFLAFDQAMGDPAGPSGPLARIGAFLRMVPYMGALRKYSRMSTHAFASKLSDPFLREAFLGIFPAPELPMIGLIFTLAWMHNRDAGYPIGGSLAFSRNIEQRYLDLGGEIHYRSPVARILVEGVDGEPSRAVGVRLVDGTEHRADAVISAADGHATLFDMLDGRFLSDELRRCYDEWLIFPPLVQVSLGLGRDLSAEPHSVNLLLDEPLTVAGEARERMSFKHYCYDPTLAPEGKSVVIALFPSDYDYWVELAEERERYDAEKQEIAIGVIERLEKRFPGVTAQVEAVDVATPLTTERYTGNWRGSMEGWLPTTENAETMFTRPMSKTLPGLENFYMAGQWVEPGGGLPPAAMSGRSVVQMICKRDGRRFEAQLA